MPRLRSQMRTTVTMETHLLPGKTAPELVGERLITLTKVWDICLPMVSVLVVSRTRRRTTDPPKEREQSSEDVNTEDSSN